MSFRTRLFENTSLCWANSLCRCVLRCVRKGASVLGGVCYLFGCLSAHGQGQLQLQLLLSAGLGPRLFQLRRRIRRRGWNTHTHTHIIICGDSTTVTHTSSHASPNHTWVASPPHPHTNEVFHYAFILMYIYSLTPQTPSQPHTNHSIYTYISNSSSSPPHHLLSQPLATA